MVHYTSTWTTWNNDASTSTATCSGDLWRGWITSTTSTATTSTGVWHRWVASGPVSRSYVTPTADRDSASAREEARKKAEVNAKQLLLDLIGTDALNIYKQTGRLFVRGEKYDYIIQKEGHIKRVEKDKITDLCIHLDNRYRYPSTDNVIALKLAIEADEGHVLRVANKHGSVKRPETLPLAACM